MQPTPSVAYMYEWQPASWWVLRAVQGFIQQVDETLDRNTCVFMGEAFLPRWSREGSIESSRFESNLKLQNQSGVAIVFP